MMKCRNCGGSVVEIVNVEPGWPQFGHSDTGRMRCDGFLLYRDEIGEHKVAEPFTRQDTLKAINKWMKLETQQKKQ